jgi:DEAD/DEAH box helicase domain-containing protein
MKDHMERETMAGETYVFDVETQRLANEVGGWSHIDKLGLSAAVLFHVESGKMLRFLEKDVEDLIDRILRAKLVVGFNVVRFDYTVLKPYGLLPDSNLLERTVDLLHHIYNALGFRLSLDSLAQATLNIGKSADGIMAVKWYREGKLDQILDYCEQDVRVTHQLWQDGKEHGHVLYHDKFGQVRRVQVMW